MSFPRITCALAALVILTTSCVSPGEHRRLLDANRDLQAQLADLNRHQDQLGKENERLRSDVDRLSKSAVDADALRAKEERIDELLKRFGVNNSADLQNVEMIQTSEGAAFRVLGGVLFASGKADVTDQGRRTLQQLVEVLKGQGKRIRIDGHTDDEPITHSAWGTNLRLSVARSLAVADFLIQAGVPAGRIGVAGYGEHQPTMPGSSESARSANRRVEILMLDR